MDTALSLSVFRAAKRGYIRGELLKRVLEKQTTTKLRNIVNMTFNGRTALVTACLKGHVDLVKLLVEKCYADIEQVGAFRFREEAPPLWCASAEGQYDIVKYLVSKNANVNSTTSWNSTPLRIAIENGHYLIVKHLVEFKADIEHTDLNGDTCLMLACYLGEADIVKLLLDAGANINSKNIEGTDLYSFINLSIPHASSFTIIAVVVKTI